MACHISSRPRPALFREQDHAGRGFVLDEAGLQDERHVLGIDLLLVAVDGDLPVVDELVAFGGVDGPEDVAAAVLDELDPFPLGRHVLDLEAVVIAEAVRDCPQAVRSLPVPTITMFQPASFSQAAAPIKKSIAAKRELVVALGGPV
jgi:hypothetical protein